MKIDTYPGERMIYIELIEGTDSVDSQEVSTGVVIDYADDGQPIGIEIDVDAILTLPALQKAHE